MSLVTQLVLQLILKNAISSGNVLAVLEPREMEAEAFFGKTNKGPLCSISLALTWRDPTVCCWSHHRDSWWPSVEIFPLSLAAARLF